MSSTYAERLQERLQRQDEDRHYNEHRAKDALRAMRLSEIRTGIPSWVNDRAAEVIESNITVLASVERQSQTDPASPEAEAWEAVKRGDLRLLWDILND